MYWFCYYHQYAGKQVNYHHVIIKAELETIGDIVFEDCSYFIREITQIHLSEKDTELKYYKDLIMDGESLLKKMKAATKLKNESIRLQYLASNGG